MVDFLWLIFYGKCGDLYASPMDILWDMKIPMAHEFRTTISYAQEAIFWMVLDTQAVQFGNLSQNLKHLFVLGNLPYLEDHPT